MNEALKHNLIINAIVAIRNIVAIVVFAKLAIYFNTWWIVFFSIIFFCYIEKDEN